MYVKLRADDDNKFEAVISVLGAINDIKGLNFHDAEVNFEAQED